MKKPVIPESAFIAKGAAVIGDVTLGENVSVWYNTVIRADNNHIEIGDNTNVQDLTCLHCSPEHGIKLGKNIVIGHNAIIHGCTIDDNVLIGMGAIVLDGAHIGSNCIIGAGSLVTQGTVIPDNSLALGSPCRVKRSITESDLLMIKDGVEEYIELAKKNKEL